MIRILRQGLPLIGMVKIGEGTPKSGNRGGAPIKFDHFELTGVERDDEGRLLSDVATMRRLVAEGGQTCGGCARSKELAKRFGVPEFEKGLPVELGILLPYDDLELNFPNRLAYHKGRTEFCRGDGEKAERRRVEGHRQVEDKRVEVLGAFEEYGPCGNACADFEQRRCKPKARLRFVLGLQQNVGGCYEFRTTSWNSIANLQESLQLIQQFTGGALQWIPLHFELAAQTVQPKGGGRANKAYIARVTFKGGPAQLIATVKENLRLRGPLLREMKQLEASLDRSWDMSPEEVRDFREEFDPDGLASEATDAVTAEEPPEASAPPAAPATQPEPAPAAAQPGEAEATADQPIGAEDKRELWKACKRRAEELGVEGGPVLRGALDAHGYRSSDDVPMSGLYDLMETIRSWE